MFSDDNKVVGRNSDLQTRSDVEVQLLLKFRLKMNAMNVKQSLDTGLKWIDSEIQSHMIRRKRYTETYPREHF